MDSFYISEWSTFFVILLTIVWLVVKHKTKTKTANINCHIILESIQENKLFPLGPEQGWRLIDLCFEQRVWQTTLNTAPHDGCSRQLNIYGCYSEVKGTAQSVLSALTDISKYLEWRTSVCEVSRISSFQSDSVSNQRSLDVKRENSSDSTRVQADVIRVCNREKDTNFIKRAIDVIKNRISGRKSNKTIKDISRCWNKEENGCCWLLEILCHQPEWTFYLIQPVEKWFEIDHCLLTVLHCPAQSRYRPWLLAEILTAFQNYNLLRKVQCVPLVHITLNEDISSENVINSEQSPDPVSKAKAFFDGFVAKLTKDDDKKESEFMKKVKSLIEEKKEWYEEKKRRVSKKTSGKNKAKDATAECILCEGQTQLEMSESDREGMRKSSSENVKPLKHRLLKSKTATECNHQGRDDGPSSSLSQRIKKRLWSERPSKSLDCVTQTDDKEVIPDKQDNYQENDNQINNDTESSLEAVYNEVGKDTVTEILAVKSKISNIDIQLHYELQAKRSGGWVYCGLEKEVVVLKKVHRNGAPVQSFLGKGLIACPPKQVFETLRNPSTRFTYDDMLKKMELMHEFQNGMKILYWYHEVSQMFKKECRDFCILQYEQIGGSRYVIGLRSVKWPGCLETDDIHRATLHASGWIIEPAPKDNKLYSMVTYIVQMELGRTKGNTGFLVEELAVKQPLCVAFLRQYLVPASTAPPSSSQRRKSQSLIMEEYPTNGQSDREDALSVLAAQYNNVTDMSDIDSFKPVLC